jgi:hypothetical protein
MQHTLRPGSALAVLISAFLAAGTAHAQHACCRESGCIDVQTESQCNTAGGFYLPSQSCAQDACGTGACCSPISCFATDAYSCMSEGRDFAGAGLSCLTDPCGGQIGACCRPGGQCSQTTLPACQSLGGGWLGGGTSCASGLCNIGACCAPGSCQQVTGFDCLSQGGTFRTGASCAGGSACDVAVDACPLDSLYSQPPESPSRFTAGTSEVSVGAARFDDYHAADGPITGLSWWGIDVHFTGTGFVECVESNNTFHIRFHENDAGTPGLPVCDYTVVATSTPTGRVLGGFDENLYRATLPSSCPLPHGWISIVGAGSTTCEFLWVSAPEVDDRSYCDACNPQNQPFDLSFCLRGSTGGVTGACCDWSTGICADNVDIAACAEDGQHFNANGQCQDMTPACDVETGACCRPDGTCGLITAAQCDADNGRWLGPGASCELCPKLGGCCLAPGNCTLDTAQDCASAGRTYAGDGTSCADCPPIPTCAPTSIFSQNTDGSDFFVAYQSEAGSTIRFENLPGVAGTIASLTWWGLDLEPLGAAAFRECAEPSGQFDITIYEDAAGVPGDVVCAYTVTPTYTPTVHRYIGATLNEYSVTLPSPCVVRNPWVSLVGKSDPACRFFWMSSSDDDGTHFCEGCDVEFADVNLSICAGGTQGGVSGACCHGPAATCLPNTDISACAASLDRFIPGGACGNFDPPCGVILGACCFAQTATCARLTQSDCAAQQGSWLGGNSLCSRCPCAVACPPGSVIEGEPTCFNGYTDNFNGGCDSSPPKFTLLNQDSTVCGAGGVFDSGEDVIRDVDWYRVNITGITELTWSVEATFPIQAWILDGNSGCPGTTMETNAGFECESVTMSAYVTTGQYWLVVAAIAQTDTSECGSARYTGHVSVRAPNAGDVDGDGDVDLVDYADFAECLYGPDVPPTPLAPPTPQDCLLSFDFNVDGDVDLPDFAEFMQVFGSTSAARIMPVRTSRAVPLTSPAEIAVEPVLDGFRPGYRLVPAAHELSTADECRVGPE